MSASYREALRGDPEHTQTILRKGDPIPRVIPAERLPDGEITVPLAAPLNMAPRPTRWPSTCAGPPKQAMITGKTITFVQDLSTVDTVGSSVKLTHPLGVTRYRLQGIGSTR